MGGLRPFITPCFRWASAAGPRAGAAPDASLVGADWRQLALRCDECAGALHAPNVAKVQLVRRHANRAFHLIAERRALASHEEFATQAVPWVCAMVAALASAHPEALWQLAVIARAKATRADSVRGKQRKKEWTTWLKGGTPRQSAPSKRAFLFLKGAAGWTRSPTADDAYNDEVPDDLAATN